MPTDSNGVHSLPPGYLAVTGQTVLASQHNPPLEDLSASMTARMPRNGSAPMTGPLKLADGTVSIPSLAFSSQPSWGVYKTSTGYAVTIGGKVAEFIATGLSITGDLSVTGTISGTLTGTYAGNATFSGDLTFSGANVFSATTSVTLPTGTTAQEPAAGVGKARYDTDLNRLRVSSADAFSSVLTADDAATQSEMEAATETDKFVSPENMKSHPGVAKAWAFLGGSGTTLAASYNVASFVKNGTGDYTITFDIPFSSANFAAVVTPFVSSGKPLVRVIAQTASTVRIGILDAELFSQVDPSSTSIICFGDQ